jgi:glycosyltransferase involved in cell wall biosynthesis
MHELMEVAVIIPTCRPGSYLYDCLYSILAQDFSRDKFEVVIVLNGDKNPYYEYIESFFRDKDVNFKLLYTPQKGVSNARNLALDNTNSKYIAFLDDDDILSSNYISLLYLNASLNFIVVSNVKTFSSDLNTLGDDYISNCYKDHLTGGKYSLFKYRGFLSSACAKLIPRNVINEFRFDKSLSYGEDALFMFVISCNVKGIKLADENAIYYRRIRQGSASQSYLTLGARTHSMLLKLSKYSSVYIRAISRYNFLLFTSRIAATIKVFLLYYLIKRGESFAN